MRSLFGLLKKTFTSFQIMLLVVLSCAVLAAIIMVVFDELELLEPTPVEKMVYVWHQNNTPEVGTGGAE